MLPAPPKPTCSRMDNSPINGPMDWEKERRWQREREAAREQFARAVAYFIGLSDYKKPAEYERYQNLNGLHARLTLENYVKACLDGSIPVKPFT